MMMNLAFASPAYCSTIRVPLKQLFLIRFNLLSRRRRPRPRSPLPSFYTFNCPNPNILSANPIFFVMQDLLKLVVIGSCHRAGCSCPLVWLFRILLLVSSAVECSQVRVLRDSVPFAETFGPESDIGNSIKMGAILANKSFLTGTGLNRNKAMVEYLQRYGMISSSKVAGVMETVDRALFVPEGSPPYVDSPMPIGYNATISAPHMHATCLQLLEKHLQPGMRALDVGSGTGYLTACFALMVESQGRAVGVEHIPELTAQSIKNIEKSAAAPLLKEGSLSVHVGDGRLGWPECAPYDAIHVGAAAEEIPKPLIDQLKPGGRMLIPVGNIYQDLQVVDKNLDGSVSVHTETSVRYVPLTSREKQINSF